MPGGISVALQLSVKLGIHGLPLRSAVIARRRRRLRILAAMAALALVAFVGAVAREVWPHRAEVVADVSSAFVTPAADAPAPAPAAAARPVYRHSIVPGGAYSRDEVAGAMRKDKVVAAHYEDVDVDKLHATTVDAARAVYVSYRVGDKTFWTKDRVRLSPGETVLTDGDTEIRARCGNLLSDTAQQPVADEEPPLAALDEEEAPETGSSTIADARGPDGALTHVPFFSGPLGPSGMLAGGFEPAGPSGFDAPIFGGGVGGGSPFLGSAPGTAGTSPLTPLGGSPRPPTPTGGGPKDGPPVFFVPPTTTTTGDSTTTGGTTTGGTTTGGTTTGSSTTGTATTGDLLTTTGGTDTTTTGESLTTTGNVVIDTTGDTTGRNDDDGDVPTVPEPGTLMLVTMGAIGVAARAIRARRG
jgi:hypothetical protein